MKKVGISITIPEKVNQTIRERMQQFGFNRSQMLSYDLGNYYHELERKKVHEEKKDSRRPDHRIDSGDQKN